MKNFIPDNVSKYDNVYDVLKERGSVSYTHLDVYKRQEAGKLETWMNKKFGEKGTWNIMIYLSVILALAMTIGMFILLPTVVANFMKPLIDSDFLFNLVEGVMLSLIHI